MTMQRRSFLAGMLAAAAAPAFVKAGVLMPVRQIIVPEFLLWGDGIRDDTLALQALIHGKTVTYRGERYVGRIGNTVKLPTGSFLIAATQTLSGDGLHLQGSGAKLIRSPLMGEGPALHFQGTSQRIENITIGGFDSGLLIRGAA